MIAYSATAVTNYYSSYINYSCGNTYYEQPAQPRRTRNEQLLADLQQAYGKKLSKFLYREEQNARALSDARSRERRPPRSAVAPSTIRMQTTTAALAARGLSRRWV